MMIICRSATNKVHQEGPKSYQIDSSYCSSYFCFACALIDALDEASCVLYM